MPTIAACELPQGALLRKYQTQGAFTDCYTTEITCLVANAEFIEAFYTTALFKIERRLLGWFVARPSTDIQAGQLAAGTISRFAAWNVEARTADQLLMADFQGHTRSWLMVAATDTVGNDGTRLYFGSAIVPAIDRRSGRPKLGLAFRLLLGFHNVYSKALLFAARSRIAQQQARRKSP